jgi:hypothetical protein
LYYLSFELRLLITSLISVGHCFVCPVNNGFWLPLWYLLAIVLSILWITASDYLFDICLPLYCLSCKLRLLITPLIFVGHCIVYLLNYGFWLPLWYLLDIVLSVLWITLLITSLISFGHCIACPSNYASHYPFDILWPLYCLSFELRLLITHLIYVGHCIVCPLNYSFWLPIWHTLAIVLPVLWSTASDYPFDILWPLYYLSFDLRLLTTPLVSFGHCIVCPLQYGFWLPLWYLLAIVLPVLWITALWITLCLLVLFLFSIWFDSLSFELRLLITSLISVGHSFVCPVNYSFWLPLWYLLAIVLSILWITASDYLFDICWPLYCLSCKLRLLITPLIFVGHCIVYPLNYGFWLPLWYLLAIVLSVLWITLLITSLISFGHCIACPSNYGFSLPIWYTLAIVLSVLW